MAEALWILETRCLWKGDPAETVLPWKDDASAVVQPARHLNALQDSGVTFPNTDWIQMMHRRFEPLVLVVPPVTVHPSL